MRARIAGVIATISTPTPSTTPTRLHPTSTAVRSIACTFNTTRHAHPRRQFSSSSSSSTRLIRDYTASALRGLKIALAFTLGLHIFHEYFFTWEFTWGISMLPTLAADGGSVIVSRYYRRGRGVGVGDLVSFRHPVDEHVVAVKRVVGLAGDFVLRDSPHRAGRHRSLMMQVPDGHCYVVGDNLNYSRDSRLYGPLPLALITGRVTHSVSRDNWLGLPWLNRLPRGLQAAQVEVVVD